MALIVVPFHQDERLPAALLPLPAGRPALVVEPDLPESIAILPGGPIWVRGGLAVNGSGGQTWDELDRVTLCRCGGSANKPFCDGTHQSRHFDER